MGYDEKNINYSQVYILLFIVLASYIGITISTPIFAPLFLIPIKNGIIPYDWNHVMRSILFGVVIAIYPLGQFLGAPFLGRLSDNQGRIRTLFFTLGGASIGYLITAAALYFKLLSLLLLSRFITGFLEGNVAIVQAALSERSGDDKPNIFGKLSAAATSGRILGPIVGGVFCATSLVSWFNFYLPFIIGSIILLCLSCISFFYLHDFLPNNNLGQASKKNKFLTNLKSITQVNNWDFKHFLLTWFFIIVAADLFDQFLPAFLAGKWHMSPLSISLFIVMLCIWYVIGSMWLVPFLSKKITSDRALSLGLLIFSISLFMILIPSKSYYLFPLFAFCDLSLAMVLVNSYIQVSSNTKIDRQGEVMGLICGLRTLADTLIGLVGGILIASSIMLPILSSALLAFSIFLILIIRQFFQGRKSVMTSNHNRVKIQDSV